MTERTDILEERVKELEGQVRALTGSVRAKPFDLDTRAEWVRLAKECRGYLKTCHNKHGTDWEGRQAAIDALDAIALKGEKL